MLSRFRRGKSETKQEGKPLRGMPALKQMRSTRRQEELKPKLLSAVRKSPDGDKIQQANGIAREPLASRKSKDDSQVRVREYTRPHQRKDNRLSYQEPPASNMSFDIRPTRAAAVSSAIERGKRESLKSNGSDPASPRSTTENKKNRGRHLHSIKKIRKESRESTVTPSMRALTPLERESILCLEEVIQQHEFNFNDENVFDSPIYEQPSDVEAGTSTSESDNASVGSFIDLVGNLSVSSSPPMSDGRSSQSSISNNYNNNNYNSNNSFSTSRPEYRRSVDETPADEAVYAQVDRKHVERKRAQRLEKDKAEVRKQMISELEAGLNKPRKPVVKKAPETRDINPLNNSRDPTPKSSRQYWEKKVASNQGRPLSSDSESNHSADAFNFGPTRSERSSGSSRSSANSKSDRVVTGVSPTKFTVVPAGSARRSSSSLSSRGSYQSDAASDDLHAQSSPSKASPPKKSSNRLSHPETDSDADSGCQADPKMIAVPKQAVLSSDPNKKFVVYSSRKHVVDLS